jgi:hypothetical protein
MIPAQEVTAVEEATGRCTGCGAFPVRGQLVSEVVTNSGPHWSNVRCPGCADGRVRLSAPPSGFRARRGRWL